MRGQEECDLNLPASVPAKAVLMSGDPGVRIEALDAGYKVELRQYDTAILYVFISPQLLVSEPFATAVEAWDAAYADLQASLDKENADKEPDPEQDPDWA
jgi:hypothetical protein